MYYIYILLLSNKRLYSGLTSNLQRRLKEHKSGKSKYTSRYQPVKLIFYEVFNNRKDAEKRERYFKTSKGKASLRALLRNTLDK